MSLRERLAGRVTVSLLGLLLGLAVADVWAEQRTGAPTAPALTKRLVLLPLEDPSYPVDPVQGSTGHVDYDEVNVGRLTVRVTVRGLRPNVGYWITLNGNLSDELGRSSNRVLMEICKKAGNEGFCDLGPLKTDSTGNASQVFTRDLPPGKYLVKFLVKKMGEPWPLALHNNSFSFSIKRAQETSGSGTRNAPTTPAVSPEPETDRDTGPRDMLVAGGILLVLVVAFVFAKYAYANALVGRKIAPRSANTAGWWLFILLTSLATVAVLGVVNQARFLTLIFLAPLGLVVLLSLALMVVSSRR